MSNSILKILLPLLLCLLTSLPIEGKAAGVGSMLFDLASALKKKDLSRLRELIDAQSMVYVRSILQAPGYPKKDPLESLSDTSSLDGFRRMEAQLFDRLGNGMEQDACRYAWRSGCPWVPEALAKAVLVEDRGETAIYAVDNKRGIRTWLLLKKTDGLWRAWAIAESDQEARLIASQEFSLTLSNIRRELPARIEAKAKARADQQQATKVEYQKRAAEIAQRNREEKMAKEAVSCRILRMNTEERVPPAAIPRPPYMILSLILEVHNTNSFAILPKTWVLTFSRPDGTQVKSITMDHNTGGDALPLAAGERKTLMLTTRQFDADCLDGWNKDRYAAKAELLNGERR